MIYSFPGIFSAGVHPFGLTRLPPSKLTTGSEIQQFTRLLGINALHVPPKGNAPG